MLTEQQLEQRRQGIGGSDAAAVVGLSRYKTPVDVYLQKLGLAPDDEESEAAYWGNVLEAVVASEFVRINNELFKHSGDLIKSKKYPWMIANVDRLLSHKNAVLECKTASAYKSGEWGEENTDEMPDEYLLQCAHYRIVTNCDYVALAVLIGGQTYRQYKYEKNTTLEERLIEKEYDFWHKNVLASEPPQIKSYEDALKLFNAASDSEKKLNAEIGDQLNDYLVTKFEIKKLTERADTLKTAICSYLGNDSVLLDELEQSIATWKKKTMRRLNIDKLKQEQPDIYKQYLNETVTREFRLKRGLEIHE
jgi:putative phage-type endonuclease